MHRNRRSGAFGAVEKRITVLLCIDCAIMAAAFAHHDSGPDAGKSLHLSALALHVLIGLWIGRLITRAYPGKWMAAAYWLSVITPMVSLAAPLGLIPLRIFLPFGTAFTAVFIQWSILLGLLSGRFTKGRWPLAAAFPAAMGAGFLMLMNLCFDTTEFGPMGMLFVNLLASPAFFILPALVRIPAADEIKANLKHLQIITYCFVLSAWIVFGVRV